MAVQPFDQLCVTMVVTKNRATMLSRSALALWGRAGIESSSNRVKGPSFVERREILRTKGKICFFSSSLFCPSLQNVIKWTNADSFRGFPLFLLYHDRLDLNKKLFNAITRPLW